ncbi:MAG: hypothetical protein ACF8MF_13395 [Phycisphaerales bacterium JB052]
MLIPNASEIARRKWTVRIGVRAIALLFATLSLWPIVSWLTEGYMDNDTWNMGYYADRVAIAVFLLIIASVAWFTQKPISRMLVPIPKGTRCPKCNHRIEGMTEPICTECGLELTPEFITPTGIGDAPDSRSTDPRTIPFRFANRRSIAANCFRFVGILVLLWAILSLIGSMIMVYMNDADFFLYAVASLVRAVLTLIIGAAMTFAPARLARFCVPMPQIETTNTPRDETTHPQSPTTPCGDGPATG